MTFEQQPHTGMRFVMWGLLCMVMMPAATGGAEEPARLEETEEVVVSATKTRQPVSKVTSAVTVITGEQLERRNLKTVADALRLAEGLATSSFGGPGTFTDVRIRGGTSQQVLVFIDGVNVGESTTEGNYNFADLRTDNIERIEILRGNQSMLWGADAMGGVINITTKRGRGAPALSAFLEYGSFQSLREGGVVSGQKGPVDFSATLSRWDTTSFSVINDRRGAAERDGYHNWHGSARLGVTLPKDSRLDLNLRWMNSSINTDGFAIVGGRNDPADVLGAKNTRDQLILAGSFTQPLTREWSHHLTVGRAVNDLSGQTGTFRRNLVTGRTENLRPRLFDVTSYNNRIEWQHTVRVAKPVQVVAGYQFREQVGRSKGNFDTKIIASHAGFADVQLNLWDRLFGTAGLRHDAYNMFGSATTYRVTAGYRHQETDTKIRGSYATGFRTPTLSQLYFPGFGTLNLQPEHSQGLDVGLEQAFFRKRATLSAGYFWTRYQDLLLSTFNPARCPFSPQGFCSQNIGAAKAHGWESSFAAILLEDRPWIARLDIQGQYTYTMTRDLAVRSGNRLPLWPVHQWSSVVSYHPVKPLQINLEFRHMGQRFNDTGNQQFLPAFDVWNAAATYTINPRLQVYARAENLFDRQYEERLFLGTPGFSIYGGVRVSFGGE